MALPFVSPPSRSPLYWINLVADAVVSLTNKLVTASGLSAWIAARSTALTAPGTGDGQRLVREADCTTAATAANPVLSVGGLTARSVSAPGVAVGTRLLTEADRPRTVNGTIPYACTISPAAPAGWGLAGSPAGAAYYLINAAELPAVLPSTGVASVVLATLNAGRVALRLCACTDEAGSNPIVLATGQDGASVSGARLVAMTVTPAAWAWSGTRFLHWEAQLLAGGPVGTTSIRGARFAL